MPLSPLRRNLSTISMTLRESVLWSASRDELPMVFGAATWWTDDGPPSSPLTGRLSVPVGPMADFFFRRWVESFSMKVAKLNERMMEGEEWRRDVEEEGSQVQKDGQSQETR